MRANRPVHQNRDWSDTPGFAENIICAVLRREPAAWDFGDDRVAIEQLLRAGRYHGVLPLLHHEFRRGGGFTHWPEAIRETCRDAALVQAMHELVQGRELTRVLDKLAAVGATALVLKGTALALSHYPNAATRPRGDTDLLIPPSTRNVAARTLEGLGYQHTGGLEGEFVSYQGTWSLTDGLGIAHRLDVHWRISNSQILAKLLEYDELAARAEALPPLGANARALRAVDALLFACIHRAGHAHAPYYVDGVPHPGIDRLIWLYDIHLLVSNMSETQLDEFAELAASKKVKAICLAALVRTHQCLGTAIPARINEGLASTGPAEESAHYLSGGRLRQMFGDCMALERWSDRGRWVLETAFPPGAYMRNKYPNTAMGWLPLLYARRGFDGMARLLFARDDKRGN